MSSSDPYVAIDQVFRPGWRGKPVVVLSNNDGCVVAANRHAKEAGIEKFKPFFQVKALCEQKGVIALSSNYELYADLSSKMMQVIGRMPQISISTVSMNLSYHSNVVTLPFHAENAWNEAETNCVARMSLTRLVGFGPTLTLAKIANHAAKKIQGYNVVCVLDNEHERRDILSKLSAGDVWGIGKKILARKEFNVEIERTIRELNGQPCKAWDQSRADKKQIYSTRSAGQRITDLESLRQALAKHVNIASSKARQQNSLCKVMLCFANSSPFDEKAITRRTIHRFAYPTSDVTQITKAATLLAEELFCEDVRFYKIGVGLLELTDGKHEQSDLFNPMPNDPKLMSVYDSLNQRYGSDTLLSGSTRNSAEMGHAA
ncbi:DNA polymerase V subunit UmuC [Vibrio tapetis subsp. quintayensis]|uniref:Y-family DNA polymerase n=1 Tax=Vibrio tapetis TaxID=52443 RepID=UPI0025B497FF|nr:Y-family DNA polymerase [Vibrio tapetis]MDN3683245.1 DNA polymerase V subunit UmuC [Vibrio tapetis subsp. quintayensis]